MPTSAMEPHTDLPVSSIPQATASDNSCDAPRQIANSPRGILRIAHLLFRTRLHDDVYSQDYAGNGTDDNPYVIDFLHNDSQDARNLSKRRKWTIVVLQSLSTFVVTFASSVYASGLEGVERRFNVSGEVATLGLSLYVLGFAFGPLLWASLSEVYGRTLVYVVSFAGYTAFSVAAACSPNIAALLVLRFFASAFGASSLSNSGGMIADMFNDSERGSAMALFVMAPFLGPALGPIAGGFLGETEGWRWILGLVAIMGGVVWIASTLTIRETHAPFILQNRAKALSRATGSVYVSRLDVGKPPKTLSRELSIALTRPWILLLREPIVLVTSLYVAIVYATLYMFFGGFAIVFEVSRGWSQGIAGLPFIGVAIGVILATLAAGVDNKRYVRLCAAIKADGGIIEPEARLHIAMIGSVVLPVGLFLFAWTTYPSVPWIVPVIGAVLFACGLVMVFISLLNYVIDSYTFYAASALAANSLVRSLLAAGFPLFTVQMYDNLGDQWASSIPAFLALGCLPFPFLFYKYGPQIRSKSKYASEAAEMLELIRHRSRVMTGNGSAGTEVKDGQDAMTSV